MSKALRMTDEVVGIVERSPTINRVVLDDDAWSRLGVAVGDRVMVCVGGNMIVGEACSDARGRYVGAIFNGALSLYRHVRVRRPRVQR